MPKIVSCLRCGGTVKVHDLCCGGADIDPKCNIPSDVVHHHAKCDQCIIEYIVAVRDQKDFFVKQ